MKRNNPRQLAIANSFLITLFSVVVYIAICLITTTSIYFLYLIPGSVLLFFFSFFLMRYTIEKFIYRKIKLIYKSIYQFKVSSKEKRSKSAYRGDLIEKAQEEVIAWGEESKKKIEQLEKLAAYRREYIGNIFHELKTPIFNIQGYVLTLLDGGLDDPTINKEYLLRTEKSINRMIDIIDDLETISKLEAETVSLKIEKFDIISLTQDIVDLLEIKARKKKNSVYFAGNYDPVYVKADKEKIQQVLSNLIDNAIKYGKPKGGNTKISFFDMDENILVEVTDDGIGIPRESINRVFERFYRTEEGRKRESKGTGLGLSIVKHIIEAHNQTINVRSTVGLGTTFAFTLHKVK